MRLFYNKDDTCTIDVSQSRSSVRNPPFSSLDVPHIVKESALTNTNGPGSIGVSADSSSFVFSENLDLGAVGLFGCTPETTAGGKTCKDDKKKSREEIERVRKDNE